MNDKLSHVCLMNALKSMAVHGFAARVSVTVRTWNVENESLRKTTTVDIVKTQDVVDEI